MSISKMQEFKWTDTDWTARFVGFMLADHLNDGTGRCDPSVGLLATETGLDERSISRAIKRLEEAGHITVLRGRGVRNAYRLHPIQSTEPPAQSHPRQKVTPGTESPPPPAESRGDPRHVDGTPPAQSPPNHNKPQKNPNLNRKDGGGEKINLPEDAHHSLHEAWAEWQAYRQSRTTAKGKQKLAWTEQAARMGAKQVMDYSKSHGVRIVCDRIASAIGGGWQGMNLDKLEVQKQQTRNGQYAPLF